IVENVAAERAERRGFVGIAGARHVDATARIAARACEAHVRRAFVHLLLAAAAFAHRRAQDSRRAFTETALAFAQRRRKRCRWGAFGGTSERADMRPRKCEEAVDDFA